MITTMPALRALFGVTRPLADCLWWGIEPISAGVFGLPVGAAVLVLGSLLSPRPQEQQTHLVDTVRYPKADER